jgi:hypothetical protein
MLGHQPSQAVILSGRELRHTAVEERRHYLFDGAFEKCFNHAA